MHPDLSPHLHTEECNVLISELKACHEENKFRKFFGICNEIDRKVIACLRKERQNNRKANLEKAREKQRQLREKLKLDTSE